MGIVPYFVIQVCKPEPVFKITFGPRGKVSFIPYNGIIRVITSVTPYGVGF
jgi:hypothetical protein